MSSEDEDGSNEMTIRHRKEKKDLRAKILAMKKAAKTGNKQKLKETNAECEKLEKELETRHKNEIEDEEKSRKELNPTSAQNEVAIKSTDVVDEVDGGGFYKSLTISKKQAKRQAKKEEADKKWKEALKEDKEAAKTSDKAIEKQIILNTLLEKNLRMVDVIADGDCMYNAVADQLERDGTSMNSLKLRKLCADYMRSHKDDFLPFIAVDESSSNATEGNSTMDPEDDWIKYLRGVENPTENGGVWGGELELNALSRQLKRVIEVFKTDGTRKYGEEFEKSKQKPLQIVYLRKAFRLGEHYNSTAPIS